MEGLKSKKKKKKRRKEEKEKVDEKKKDTIEKSSNEPHKKRAKLDFFEKLKNQEAQKQPIGTIHATGKSTAAADSNPFEMQNKDWECVKPGCGKVNDRRSTQCQKCGAMRRLSGWR